MEEKILLLLVIALLIWAIWVSIVAYQRKKRNKQMVKHVLSYVELLDDVLRQGWSNISTFNLNFSFFEELGRSGKFNSLSISAISTGLIQAVKDGKLFMKNPTSEYLRGNALERYKFVLESAKIKAVSILEEAIAENKSIKESQYLHFLYENDKDSYNKIYQMALEKGLI